MPGVHQLSQLSQLGFFALCSLWSRFGSVAKLPIYWRSVYNHSQRSYSVRYLGVGGGELEPQSMEELAVDMIRHG